MINLINDWYVVSDGTQYILRERRIGKRKDTQEEYETSKDYGYYAKMNSAVKACVMHELMNGVTSGEIDTLSKYVKRMEELEEKLDSLLDA